MELLAESLRDFGLRSYMLYDNRVTLTIVQPLGNCLLLDLLPSEVPLPSVKGWGGGGGGGGGGGRRGIDIF